MLALQDPDMQRLTAAELLKLIVKKKMSIRDESYFDDLVTLYISKQVGSYKTDDEILHHYLKDWTQTLLELMTNFIEAN